MKQTSYIIAFFCLLLFVACPLAAHAETVRPKPQHTPLSILVISSHGKDFPSQYALENGLRKVLDEQNTNYDLYFEFMFAPRKKLEDFQEVFNNYLEEKYRSVRIDFLVGWADEANIFLTRYPELLSQAKRIYLQKPKGLKLSTRNLYAVVDLKTNYHSSLEKMLFVEDPQRLLVIGSAQNDYARARVNDFQNTFNAINPEIVVEYLIDLPLPELVERLAKEPRSKTAAVYLPIFYDENNRPTTPFAIAKRLAERSNIPIYSFWESLMNSGLVGGYIVSQELFGEILGNTILTPPEQIAIDLPPMREIYDWTAIERWDIDQDKIPRDAQIIHPPPKLLKEYYPHIIIGIAFIVLQMFFIAHLILNRRKRLKAEQDLQKHQEQLEQLVTERTNELSDSYRELEESQERFRSLSDAAVEGLAFISEGRIIEINKAMANIVESPLKEVIGRNVLDFIAPEQQEIVQNNILSDYQLPYETLLVNQKREAFPVSIQGRTFTSGGKQVRVAAVRDLRELKTAEEEIKTLQGILPICSSCKKIRDDQGYWSQLEDYIQHHSDAIFSHGLCNECTKELYGDEPWYKKLDDKFKKEDPE